MDWIDLADDSDMWRVVVMAMKMENGLVVVVVVGDFLD